MTITANSNLYLGINAHLNSALQNEPGGWQSFHAEHVVDLVRAVNEGLPEGYFARAEKTLQISEIIPPVGTGRPKKTTVPDVTIYRSHHIPGVPAPTLTATAPTRSIPIAPLLTEEDFLSGIVIYQAGEGGLLGRPVTQIELLSPANKPGGGHFTRYASKRLETLQSGLRLVEIDYLHETPPILPGLPSYPAQEDGAFPYRVLVSDPRPTLAQGKTDVYEFGVDDPLPVILIPLAGADAMTLDLGAVYNRTFAGSRFFHLVVDYEADPPHFDRYMPADQARIRARLKAIADSTS